MFEYDLGSSRSEGVHVRLSERDVLHAALPASGPGEDASADPTARVSPHTRRV